MKAGEAQILNVVKTRILAQVEASLPVVSASITSDYNKEGMWAGVLAGAAGGAKLGAGIGIATAGVGMAATVPGAILGGIIGAFAGNKIGASIDKDTNGSYFTAAAPVAGAAAKRQIE